MNKKVVCLAMVLLAVFGLKLANAQTNMAKNRAAYQSSAIDYNQTAHLATDGHASTYWQSKTGGEEWIYVDLGTTCTVNSMSINWGYNFAKSYDIEVATNGEPGKQITWNKIFSNQTGSGGNETIALKGVKSRFLKLSCKKSSGNYYIVHEIAIVGKGMRPIVSTPMPMPDSKGNQYLTGGNWKLQRAEFVSDKGESLSQVGYTEKDWVPATVPGTILTSYYNIGAVPDHNYADQQLMISESFFTADFWYRNTFVVPQFYSGKKIWLNFDGINYKADVFFNGNFVGKIEGAFTRGKFDVSEWAKVGETNALAILIHKNENPGEVTEQHLNDPDGNGGIIGYDGPTFLASIGWNWIPTIRGRNTGIWNDVYLSATNAVSMVNHYIITDFNLPDTTLANVSIQVELKNSDKNPIKGVLKGAFGDVTFEQEINLDPISKLSVLVDPKSHAQLQVKNPKLWWPNGYGNQNLSKLKLEFIINGEVSDQKEVTFGFRKYTYNYDNTHLRLNVNGYPLIVRGGNWGMPEAMLRCDKEGYDLRVRLHKEMNLNMIRNWIGMTADDEFYQACDKYGIMVWDDFWLANPVDGPHPKNNQLFNDNVRDKILQRRNHASLALWCGRNEGYPPAVLDSSMRVILTELDNSRHYISSSADRPVTGLGPYETKDPKWYFTQRGTTFHSEQGIVCVPSVESMRKMMPEEKLWPINDMWGKHDWTQPRVKIYTDNMNSSYGAATGIEDFCRKAQMLNMEGPKAMLETWQSNRGPGIIVWMTHPAWPSLICQTYDYYFEPTAAYFAFKKGSEPQHVFWRADNEQIQVANNLIHPLKGAKVLATLYNFDGTIAWSDSLTTSLEANTVKTIFTLHTNPAKSNLQFIHLKLMGNDGKLISANFYWRANEYLKYNQLNELPSTEITGKTKLETKDGKTFVKIGLSNPSKNIALMCRVKLLQTETNERILPAIYSDNYFSMVPGEVKDIEIEFDTIQLNGKKPKLMVEGWNVIEKELKISN